MGDTKDNQDRKLAADTSDVAYADQARLRRARAFLDGANAVAPARDDRPSDKSPATETKGAAKEVGGVDGPDPTRFGDWERGGRCIDF